MRTFQLYDSNTSQIWEFDIDVEDSVFEALLYEDEEFILGPLDEAEAGDPWVSGCSGGSLDLDGQDRYVSYERPPEDFPVLAAHFRKYFMSKGWTCSCVKVKCGDE